VTRVATPLPRLGGTTGNQLLTSATALALAVLLLAEGATILRLGDLRTEHMFIGLVLIGPVALKLASTGYRFARYYTHASPYVAQGPPVLPLRVLAPVLVITTLLVFASGVVLLAIGHHSDLALTVHKVAFIIWGACFAVHSLWHLPRAWVALRAARRVRVPGSAMRGVLLGAALGGGLALAVALLPAVQGWRGGYRDEQTVGAYAPADHR
jgi:hypothetical protein